MTIIDHTRPGEEVATIEHPRWCDPQLCEDQGGYATHRATTPRRKLSQDDCEVEVGIERGDDFPEFGADAIGTTLVTVRLRDALMGGQWAEAGMTPLEAYMLGRDLMAWAAIVQAEQGAVTR